MVHWKAHNTLDRVQMEQNACLHTPPIRMNEMSVWSLMLPSRLKSPRMPSNAVMWVMDAAHLHQRKYRRSAWKKTEDPHLLIVRAQAKLQYAPDEKSKEQQKRQSADQHASTAKPRDIECRKSRSMWQCIRRLFCFGWCEKSPVMLQSTDWLHKHVSEQYTHKRDEGSGRRGYASLAFLV